MLPSTSCKALLSPLVLSPLAGSPLLSPLRCSLLSPHSQPCCRPPAAKLCSLLLFSLLLLDPLCSLLCGALCSLLIANHAAVHQLQSSALSSCSLSSCWIPSALSSAVLSALSS